MESDAVKEGWDW